MDESEIGGSDGPVFIGIKQIVCGIGFKRKLNVPRCNYPDMCILYGSEK